MRKLFAGILILVLAVLLLAAISQEGYESAAPARVADDLLPVKHLLADGDGHDWAALSDREKLRLAMEIEVAIDSPHDEWYFRESLEAFYRDPTNRHLSIAEAAAVLAAMKPE